MSPVTVGKTGLIVDGEKVPVYSGTVHYWRLERALWPKILGRVKELGFGMVETYIPWSIHETSPGQYDWGQIDDRKDVEAFMNLCEEMGLWLIVRPGPLINAELTDFGFPDWVLMDPEVQALTSTGSIHFDAAWGLHPPHQFPVPSYASEKFFRMSGAWFDAICPVIARHLAPSGCIVAVQSDNESCYLFHDQPYATDYSADSLSLYRHYLQDKYRNIRALNDEYKTAYASFEAVEPPRDCQVDGKLDLPWHLDWIGYKEYQITWSVARFSRMLKDRGIAGVPIFHDIAWQVITPLDVSKMEADADIDWVGMNLYCNKEDYRTAVRRIRFLAGATKLPFVPEFGSGLWSHHPKTFSPEDHEFITLTALLNGLKAINFYMLVERERWQGSPITRHGEFRPEVADFYQRLALFLQRYPLWEFDRETAGLILFNYDSSRHSRMMSTANVAHADLLGLPRETFNLLDQFGLIADPHKETEYDDPDSWIGAVSQWFADNHLSYDFADSHIPSDRLDTYPLICALGGDFMDPTDQESLLGYVEDGGAMVMGPVMPYLDPKLRPAKVLAHYLDQPGSTTLGQGRLALAGTESLGEQLAVEGLTARFGCSNQNLDLSVMTRGDQVLLGITNPSDQPACATLSFEGAKTFERVWGEPEQFQASGELVIELPPWGIEIHEVTGGAAR